MSHYDIQAVMAALPTLLSARPLLVAVDGGSGSGKSTFSREWAATDPRVQVIQFDDFILKVDDGTLQKRTPQDDYELCFDLARFEQGVLSPLAAGDLARYQAVDWNSGRLERWIQIESRGIVVIEGVYSFRPEWQRYMGFKVFVDTPSDARLQRMQLRGTNTEDQMRFWHDADEWYFRVHSPMERADLVIDGLKGSIRR